ncbi:Calcium-transporting ATPase [Psidium guajava]|nr:Calcium-transporting ATPase [Psidium guajava]
MASSRNEAGGADDAVELGLDFMRNGNETEPEFDGAGVHHHGASAVTAERAGSFALHHRLFCFEHRRRPHPRGMIDDGSLVCAP